MMISGAGHGVNGLIGWGGNSAESSSAPASPEEGSEASNNDTDNAEDNKPHALVGWRAGYNFLGVRDN